MKKFIFPLLLIFFFLAIKISNSGIRLSDTNIYFNIAYQMSHGKILYKDLFFSNFPLFAYVSSIYYFLVGQNIDLFYFTSNIEVAAITLFIYVITYRKTKNLIISAASSALYIFSFMVLSTSDHQTGIFTASLFAVLSYYFLQEKKIILSGIFISISILTKAYFLPIFLSLLIYFVIKKDWQNLLKFGISSAAAGLIVLLPALIQAPHQFFSDIFGFSLTRPEGVSKISLLWFYITKDFSLTVLLLFNILNIKKNIFFGLVSIFSLIFFFGYQDIYYFYLNFLTPFLCLSFYEIYLFFRSKFNLQKLVLPTVVFIIIFINLFTYLSSYRNLGKIADFNKIITTVTSEKPKFIYGANDITPAIIALTKIPALENVNDAHEYFFARGIYDSKFLTNKAVDNRTIIIAHGANYPEYNIKQDIMDNIVVKDTIYKKCKNILSIPVLSEGQYNRINVFKCY
jgi:uncharacterized membrane protein